MFCEQCGTPLEDDALFCYNCGAKVVSGKAEIIETEEISPTGVMETGTAVVVPEVTEQKKFCPNCGAPNGINDLFCQECGVSFEKPAEKTDGVEASDQTHKKGFRWKIIVAVVAAFAAIVLGIVFVPRILGGTTAKGQNVDFVMYLKDNELTMARKNKYEPVVVGDRMFDEPDETTGLMNNYEGLIQYSPDHQYVYYPQRIEDEGCDLYRKKLGSKKAEEEKIDSRVNYYGIIDDDRLYYVKGSTDSKLYLFHKGESEKIGSDVWDVRVSADKKYIMWLDDNRLYIQDTALKADRMKLDSGVIQIYVVSDDFMKIVYQKDDKIYVMKGMEEKEKIASNVYRAYTYDINGSLKMYYMKAGEPVSLSYYDLIEDDCLTQDRQMAEPRIEDYQRVTYKDSFWGTKKSIEVDDAYYEEMEKYQQKIERDYLRDSFESDLLAMEEYDIYYYEDAADESNKVMTVLKEQGETVDGSVANNSALMYACNINRGAVDKVRLSEIADMDYYEIQQEILNRLGEGKQLLYIANGEVHEIEDYEGNRQSVGAWANEEKQVLYIYNLSGEDRSLYSFDYGDKDASLELITDKLTRVVSRNMSELCYVKNDDELYYGDTQIAEDVGPCRVWENETILYLTDMNKNGNEGTLHLYQNGKDIEIADDVAPLGGYGIFDSDKVAFLSDYSFKKYRGDLNVYDGKKVENIDSDVTCIIF